MNFAQSILNFYSRLPQEFDLPEGIKIIYPYNEDTVIHCMKQFYQKYYTDRRKRYFLCGINPGRFGAGITGIPFTDPYHLEYECGLENAFEKKKELSSILMYDLMKRFGGVRIFYNNFYVSSISPLGFVKNQKNYNYYDSDELYNGLKEFIVKKMEEQLTFPLYRDKIYSLGKGKNYKILKKLNDQYRWFEEVIALPHPRWVMQYQRKHYDQHLDNMVSTLSSNLSY